MKHRRWSKTAAWIGLACVTAGGFAACANGTVSNAPESEDSGGGGDQDAATGRDGGSGITDGGAIDAGEDAGPSCIDDDAGCSTGYPGLCNDGNHHCLEDGGSVCVPLQTSQACYTGGATTRSKGICHDGTQSCAGSLGACEGEQLPNGVSDGGTGTPVENCFNNLDDDCDGLINNGCPTSISLGTPHALTARGGGGGAPFTPLCPANEFVSSADFYFDHTSGENHVAGISFTCAAATLIQGASSYTVTLASDSSANPSVIGTHSTNDDDSTVCGIGSLTAMTWTVGRSDTYVEGLKTFCGNGTMTFNADNTLSFNFTKVGDGNFLTYPTGTDFEDDCAANEVLVGFNVHAGLWMDNIQPLCSAIVVTYDPGTPDP